MPGLLKSLGETASPDQALLNFDLFLGNLPAGVQLFSLFKANPALLELLATIMGSAPGLAAHLSRRALLLDSVLSPDFYRPLPPAAEMTAELGAILARVDHADHARDTGHRVQIGDAGILDRGFALRGDDQEAAAACALERGQRLGAPDRERHGDAREDHQVANREHREDGRDFHPLLARTHQALAFPSLPALIAVRHATPGARGAHSKERPKLSAKGGRSSRSRLRGRGTDSDAVISRRLLGARGEMRHVGEFDYVIINNELQAAVDDLVAVVRAARLRYANQHARHLQYFDFLEQD